MYLFITSSLDRYRSGGGRICEILDKEIVERLEVDLLNIVLLCLLFLSVLEM